MPYLHPTAVRYLEVDRQGVVFNAWYLAYLDDAMTGFLADVGHPYGELMSAGVDFQLVHTELDWTGGLGFGDQAAVAVTVEAVGRTSFTLGFDVLRSGSSICRGRTVYVTVGTDGSGKRPLPEALRQSLLAAGLTPPGAPAGGRGPAG